MLREGGIIEESVKYIFASVVGGIVDQQEAISTVAKQMKKLIGVKPTTEEAASELGKRGHQGAVSTVANQIKKLTGVEPTTEEAASKLGKRGHQGAISTLTKRMKKLIGVEPTTEEAASGFGKSKRGGTVDGKASTRTSPDKASGAHTLKNGKIIMSMSERNCL
jgi:hypothetical protein